MTVIIIKLARLAIYFFCYPVKDITKNNANSQDNKNATICSLLKRRGGGGRSNIEKGKMN